MPNRMLRDWTDSFVMNDMSVHAERFFTRLIMKADDFGCYTAHEMLLKSNLYPLNVNVTLDEIRDCLSECVKSELIIVYEVDGKDYLYINNFNQRLRIKKNKYPLPPGVEIDVEKKKVTKADTEQIDEVEVEVEKDVEVSEQFVSVATWIKENVPVLLRLVQPLSESEFHILNKEFTVTQIKELLQSMGNYARITTHLSVFATFQKWSKNQKWSEDKSESPQVQTIINSKLDEKLQAAAARANRQSTTS